MKRLSSRTFHAITLLVVGVSCYTCSSKALRAANISESVVSDVADNPTTPPYISFSSVIPQWSEQDGRRVVGVTFALYQRREGGPPLWLEVQNVEPETNGRYTVVLGLQHHEGVPSDLFTSNGAHWLGISVEGRPEGQRILLVSVPYAYRAQTADRLAGHDVSEFVLAKQLAGCSQKQVLASCQGSGSSFTANGVKSGVPVATPAKASASTSGGYTDNNATEILLVSQLGTGYAIRATSTSNASLVGINSGATDGGMAIYGSSSANNGVGMRADAMASTGAGIGIWGVSSGNGTGVLGETTIASGPAYGVRGKTLSTSGIGVFGVAMATTGVTQGLRGENRSPDGAAGVFDTVGGGKILRGTSGGIERFSVDSAGNLKANLFTGSGAGLTDVNAAELNGLPASSFLTTQNGSLTSNNSTSSLLVSQQGNGFGVRATSTSSAALAGINTGPADGSIAVYGASSANNGVGVRSDVLATTGSGIGIWGASANNGTGVLGETTIMSGPAYGVRGKTQSSSGIALFGVSLSATGNTTGIRGENRSPAGTAAAFDTYPGGKILSGTSAGLEKFSVDSAGNLSVAGKVAGNSFEGSGRGLLDVNANTLNGLPASAFLRVDNPDILSNSLLTGTAGGDSGQGGLIRDDLDSIHSVTHQSRSNYHFRLSRGDLDAEGNKPDFLITPYKYGMAIEYPGVLEMWVRELSVHMHPNVSGNGPAQFWVGDEVDSGGLWATAHVNTPTPAGNVVLAADRFDHSSHGSMHFTVRNTTDSFLFTNGPLNQDVPIAQVRKIKDALQDLTSVETMNGPVDGALIADAANGLVRLGSRTNHPVQIVTGDTNAALTVFSSGNVSVGNIQDSALLSVGAAAQFKVDSAGATTIGGGTPIVKHISISGAVDFGTIMQNACASQTVTATGAADGDTVALGIPNVFGSIEGVTYFGWVSAPDVVSVRACNVKTTDVQVLGGTIRVDVWKH